MNSTKADQEACFFHHMLFDIKLHVFSFLDAKSLCNACCVNKAWNEIACNNLLWKNLLNSHVCRWNQAPHLFNRQKQLEIESDWSNKEMYRLFSPEFKMPAHQSNLDFHHISSTLESLVPAFCPGLAKKRRGDVWTIYSAKNPVIKGFSILPGQNGVTGGIILTLKGGHSIHTSGLYSATKVERENNDGESGLLRIRYRQTEMGQKDGVTTDHFNSVFVYVVDASQDMNIVASARHELMHMLETNYSPHLPVLILSCVKEIGDRRLDACNIVHLLQLSELPHPWQVIDCESDSLHSLESGFQLLMILAHYGIMRAQEWF